MINCTRCLKLQEDTEFYLRSNGTSSVTCKTCISEERKKHYKENRERLIKKNVKDMYARAAINQPLYHELKSKSCIDCGKTFKYYQMDFDHLRDKEYKIPSMIYSNCWEDILIEVSKCELVCARCHRYRTFSREAVARDLLSCQKCIGTKLFCYDCTSIAYEKQLKLDLSYGELNKRRRYWANKLKSDLIKSKECSDCNGIFHPCQMEFDHLGEKHANVSNMLFGKWEKVEKELKKCEIVCINCHRERTFSRTDQK